MTGGMRARCEQPLMTVPRAEGGMGQDTSAEMRGRIEQFDSAGAGLDEAAKGVFGCDSASGPDHRRSFELCLALRHFRPDELVDFGVVTAWGGVGRGVKAADDAVDQAFDQGHVLDDSGDGPAVGRRREMPLGFGEAANGFEEPVAAGNKKRIGHSVFVKHVIEKVN